MIRMNFNSYVSLAILFIIPVLFCFVLFCSVLFCFVFEHETVYTTQVLAVFDFYYRVQACNLTECENIQNSRTLPFDFSLMIFVSAHVVITSITAPGMFTNLCLVLLLLSADSLVPKFHLQLKN